MGWSMSRERQQQLEMMLERPERSPDELRAELLRHGGRVADLVLTRNRVSMVSVRFDAAGEARVRCNAMFLAAPEAVITALGRYLVKRSWHEWQVVKAYVMGATRGDGVSGAAGADERRGGSAGLKARGRVYDLGAIYERMNQRYFNGKVACEIGWGRRGTPKCGARARMIRFGSYSRLENVIRVNPLLDDHEIEEAFVEYIVFHEMLHAVLPSVGKGARRVHHHRAYRLLERRYPGYARMNKLAGELAGKLGGFQGHGREGRQSEVRM